MVKRDPRPKESDHPVQRKAALEESSELAARAPLIGSPILITLVMGAIWCSSIYFNLSNLFNSFKLPKMTKRTGGKTGMAYLESAQRGDVESTGGRRSEADDDDRDAIDCDGLWMLGSAISLQLRL